MRRGTAEPVPRITSGRGRLVGEASGVTDPNYLLMTASLCVSQEEASIPADISNSTKGMTIEFGVAGFLATCPDANPLCAMKTQAARVGFSNR